MVRLVSVVALGLLAACGGKSTSEPAEPAPAPVPAAAPEPAPAPDPEPEPEPRAMEDAYDVPVAGDASMVHCDEYVALVEAYMTCDKVPQDARDGARAGLDSLKAAWADRSTIPEDVRTQTDAACTQANEALREGAQAMGCPL